MIEEQLIDYARVRSRNEGGITEYMKIAAMCETHFAGLSPEAPGRFPPPPRCMSPPLPMCHSSADWRCGHAALPPHAMTSAKARSM